MILLMAFAAFGAAASAGAQGPPAASSIPQSEGAYRLPYADGAQAKVFDDFESHRPRGRVDLFAVGGEPPYRVVAAAAGRIVAIQDGHGEQQTGRAAADCRNNYVWIAHPNGEWTTYSHLAQGSVTGGAGLSVGDSVDQGQAIGVEGTVGCSMLNHVHFEVARPQAGAGIDVLGFLLDNDDGQRLRNPRFCGVEDGTARRDRIYTAQPCD